jgi:hypothetical protein
MIKVQIRILLFISFQIQILTFKPGELQGKFSVYIMGSLQDFLNVCKIF